MCDYSLMGVPNRLAREGEDLILYEFDSGTRGFTPCPSGTAFPASWREALGSFLKALVGVPETGKLAVCIPPGARLVLLDVPAELRAAEKVPRDAEVTFTQLSAQAYVHRDALRFDNGHELPLQLLDPGQRIRVLQLAAADESEALPELAEEFELVSRRVDFIASRLVG